MTMIRGRVRGRVRKAKEAPQQVLSILFEYMPKFQGEKDQGYGLHHGPIRGRLMCHFSVVFF